MRRQSDESKPYRTAAVLFATSGIIFVILAGLARNVGVFMPIGIALVILSMGFWQRSRMPTGGEEGDSSE